MYKEDLCCNLNLRQYLLPKVSFSVYPVWLSGEGNGTPLQYSRLENPMDGGAW